MPVDLDAERLSFHDLTCVWSETYVASGDLQELRVLIAERNHFSELATKCSNRINNIYRIPCKKFDTYLPYVPKREIVEAFINSITENLKFKTIIIVLYATGLRVSEVCNLRYENISRDNMEIYIPKSKNHHDRRVPISKITIDILTAYWYQYKKLREYLFTQVRNPEKPYVLKNHFLSRYSLDIHFTANNYIIP